MSEFNRISRYFAPLATKAGAAGLLDDVAELSGAGTIITTDALVEGVHFLADDPIETVARKLVRVNVSDLIAKGAWPVEALLTLGWPTERAETELAVFAHGLGEELAHWGAVLIGGDTVRSPGGLFVSLTVLGEPAGPCAPVRRSGANAGDGIWVTGRIGAGVAGLKAALAGEDGAARAAYRVPDIPPLAFAEILARAASASMDVSDGLIGDLLKLADASAVRAHLRLDQVSYFRPEPDLPGALEQARGGDDYQCLFCLPAGQVLDFGGADIEAHQIGHMEPGAGIYLTWHGNAVDMPKQAGFEHT